MRNSRFNAEELAAIELIQEQKGITRKSAVRAFLRNMKVSSKLASAAVAPAMDVKMAAANDRPETDAQVAKRNKKALAKAEPKLLTPEQRGKARAEGLRLFQLAGKPKKQDFVKVFGKKGPAWTWEARAKAADLASAEECAAKFQSLLKKAAR